MVIGTGHRDGFLTEAETRAILKEALDAEPLSGQRVLVLIPDGTRTAPIPLFFRILADLLGDRVGALDFLVALGTHPLMSVEALCGLVGITAKERTEQYAHIGIFNHRWDLPDTFRTLEVIPASEIHHLSAGHINSALPVTVNREVLDYDTILICGPTYPHEVVGFSGGNKYFFPGISGPEVINMTHWLGALLTSYAVIGSGYTPVRAIIDRAAQAIPARRLCASMVVGEHGLSGLYVGTPEEAWKAAAALSSEVHITWVDKAYQRALAVVPAMYADLWTGAKGMYKLEPVLASGGELILYAPHIDELSYTHGAVLDQIGYHGTDYFLANWDRFKDFPDAVLAHAAHVRGLCTYSDGVETPRIRLTLASKVSRARCERMGLGYRDPATIRVDDWKGREHEGVLLVPRAGERLYKLKPTAGRWTLQAS